MCNIIEKEKRLFSNKIITPKTVRELADFMFEVKEDLKKKNKKTLLTFTLDSERKSYESEDVRVFDENGLLDQTVIHRISMSIVKLDNSTRVEVCLLNSLDNEEEENYISVSGENSIWVNGIVNKLDEMISSCKTQPNYSTVINYSGIALWILINVQLFRLLFDSILKINYEIIVLAFVLGIPILTGKLVSVVTNYLDNMWPSIEIQSGPEYLQSHKVKRKWAWAVFTIVIIPIIISFCF